MIPWTRAKSVSPESTKSPGHWASKSRTTEPGSPDAERSVICFPAKDRPNSEPPAHPRHTPSGMTRSTCRDRGAALIMTWMHRMVKDSHGPVSVVVALVSGVGIVSTFPGCGSVATKIPAPMDAIELHVVHETKASAFAGSTRERTARSSTSSLLTWPTARV